MLLTTLILTLIYLAINAVVTVAKDGQKIPISGWGAIGPTILLSLWLTVIARGL